MGKGPRRGAQELIIKSPVTFIDKDRFWPQGQEWLTGIHPVGRMGRPEEIAQASVYFVSDESIWTTGGMMAQ